MCSIIFTCHLLFVLSPEHFINYPLQRKWNSQEPSCGEMFYEWDIWNLSFGTWIQVFGKWVFQSGSELLTGSLRGYWVCGCSWSWCTSNSVLSSWKIQIRYPLLGPDHFYVYEGEFFRVAYFNLVVFFTWWGGVILIITDFCSELKVVVYQQFSRSYLEKPNQYLIYFTPFLSLNITRPSIEYPPSQGNGLRTEIVSSSWRKKIHLTYGDKQAN